MFNSSVVCILCTRECSVFASCAVLVGCNWVTWATYHFQFSPGSMNKYVLPWCTDPKSNCSCRGLALLQGEHGNIGLFRVIDHATPSHICRLLQRTICISTVGDLICVEARIDCFPLIASTIKMSMQLQLPTCNSKFPMKIWTCSFFVSTD